MNNNAEQHSFRNFISANKKWIIVAIFLIAGLIMVLSLAQASGKKNNPTPEATIRSTLPIDITPDSPTPTIPESMDPSFTPTPILSATLQTSATLSITKTRSGIYYYPSVTSQRGSTSQATNTSGPSPTATSQSVNTLPATNTSGPSDTPLPPTATPDYALMTQQAQYATQTAQSLFITQTAAAQETYVVNYTAPSVSSVAPANGAISVDPNSNVIITFNKNVAVSGNWFQLNCSSSGNYNPGTGNITVSGGQLIYTINPTPTFIPGETCSLTVYAAQVFDTDAYDPPDTMAANFTSSFSIEKAPAVSYTTPGNGAPSFSNFDNIQITFDEAITFNNTAFGLVCGGTSQAFSANGSGTSTIILNPYNALPNYQSCTVSVSAAGINDVDSIDPPDTMASNYSFSFTTLSAPSEVQTDMEVGNIFYNVTGTGATNVDQDSNIRITFSEAVNLTNTSNILRCGINYFPVTVSGNMTDTLMLDPQFNIVAGTTCRINIPAENILDIDGTPAVHLTQDISHSYTIINDDPPTVSLVPVNWQSAVPVNANIVVTFSEPVTLTGLWLSLNCTSSGTRSMSGELTGTGLTITENTPDQVYTINPTTDFVNNEICRIYVNSIRVADNDSIDPPNELDGDSSGDKYDGDVDTLVSSFTVVN